jgi:hypothetical protein
MTRRPTRTPREPLTPPGRWYGTIDPSAGPGSGACPPLKRDFCALPLFVFPVTGRVPDDHHAAECIQRVLSYLSPT